MARKCNACGDFAIDKKFRNINGTYKDVFCCLVCVKISDTEYANKMKYNKQKRKEERDAERGPN